MLTQNRRIQEPKKKMTNISTLKFLIGMLIFIIILLIFTNIRMKKIEDKRIAGKSLKFYNIIGVMGIICVLILIADIYLN